MMRDLRERVAVLEGKTAAQDAAKQQRSED
jgi:hypothetical protein